jgi:HEAT repeat protein
MPGSIPPWPEDPIERAAAAAALGLRHPVPASAGPVLEGLATDPDPRVRAAALTALVRTTGAGATSRWAVALADSAPEVRRRACDLAPQVASEPSQSRLLIGVLADPDPAVVEAAAWALGELGPAAIRAGAVASLEGLARSHSDPLVREAAVAALGALGDPAGLGAVLAACSDKPAVRRRAVVALAAFEGPEVEAALEAALSDRDWQVRQAAEDLLSASRESSP